MADAGPWTIWIDEHCDVLDPTAVADGLHPDALPVLVVPSPWRAGDRVHITAPTTWADGQTGQIRNTPQVGQRILVDLDDGRVWPASASELHDAAAVDG